MKLNRTLAVSGGVLLAASATVAGTVTNGVANASAPTGSHHATHTHATRPHAQLNSLNNSGAFGRATVRVNRRHLTITVDAYGLTKGQPHAQHIHFGSQARHECPTNADDSNRDFRLSTTEGAPAYGPIVVSLTTRGDTSPDSALAVTRFPTAPRGTEHYHRTTHVSKAVARAIRGGKAVVVVHGVDYNNNGKYDFASAGASDLNPNLPAEATDPAICGVLHR